MTTWQRTSVSRLVRSTCECAAEATQAHDAGSMGAHSRANHVRAPRPCCSCLSLSELSHVTNSVPEPKRPFTPRLRVGVASMIPGIRVDREGYELSFDIELCPSRKASRRVPCGLCGFGHFTSDSMVVVIPRKSFRPVAVLDSYQEWNARAGIARLTARRSSSSLTASALLGVCVCVCGCVVIDDDIFLVRGLVVVRSFCMAAGGRAVSVFTSFLSGFGLVLLGGGGSERCARRGRDGRIDTTDDDWSTLQMWRKAYSA
ncbi:hypothetical protein LY78DRAFT_38179 [Colletotrichum sublineola]|nr:hypothetical protein LY78DRAFT_38179 [Colletotrichum sublineola]